MKGQRQASAARALILFGVLAAAAAAATAWAAETITYHYDARGRLVKVVRTGTVNNNVVTAYELDKADNRTKKETSGAP